MIKTILIAALVSLPFLASAQPAPAPGETHVPVTITGGFETVPQDRGRPVILIASALNVPPTTFREAFSHVKPAGPGQQPQEEQVRKNKAALMSALGPLGVTDDRLNEVSNYYRYNRSRGETWKHTSAEAYATVINGAVTGVTITKAGSGYSSPPSITIPGMDQTHLEAMLAFGTDLATNGSIKTIAVAATPKP